ncbi:MAG: protoporphyrinogen oxidase HemJ [Pseudomonadota bacterium]
MYELIKALHIISLISWMAGLLYLPRLFVYHCDAVPGSDMDRTFQTMERRLYRFIMTPAMVATWVFGLWLAISYLGFSQGWLHAKLLLVFALSGLQGYFGGRIRAFAQGRNTKSKKFYKIINEIPTVLMIVIVILVVLKPF